MAAPLIVVAIVYDQYPRIKTDKNSYFG